MHVILHVCERERERERDRDIDKVDTVRKVEITGSYQQKYVSFKLNCF